MISLIEGALAARVQALWTGDVAWEGRRYEPVAGRPYLSQQIMAQSRTPMGAGEDAPHEWRGVLMLVVRRPAEDGKPAALAQAEALLKGWKRGLTLVNGAARVIVESAEIQPAFSTPERIAVPVAIRWFCQEFPS